VTTQTRRPRRLAADPLSGRRGPATLPGMPPLQPATLAAVQEIYDDAIRPLVHQRW
jgi:hypothetical protein